MKLAVFSDTFYPQINGVSRVLEKYLEYMEKKHIDYVLFVAQKDNRNCHDRVVAFGGPKIPFYPDLRIARPRYIKTKSILKCFKPDIVHLVTPFIMGLTGIKYAYSQGLPCVASYHTNFDQYLSYYDFSLLSKPINRYLKWFHSFSQINFCPSRSTLSQLQKLGIRNPAVCPNGVDIEAFSPDYRSIALRKSLLSEQEKPILLYVGRIAPEKSLDVLLKAAQILNSNGKKYQLLLVGDGPSRSKLESLKIENVRFLGYKSGRELQELYASADIFVFPSTTETFGNVILEAMASGLPVVATPVGGVSDILLPMTNGLSFKPGDAADMAKAIQTFLENEDMVSRLAANAVTFAQRMTWDGIFDEFFAQLQCLLLSQAIA